MQSNASFRLTNSLGSDFHVILSKHLLFFLQVSLSLFCQLCYMRCILLCIPQEPQLYVGHYNTWSSGSKPSHSQQSEGTLCSPRTEPQINKSDISENKYADTGLDDQRRERGVSKDDELLEKQLIGLDFQAIFSTWYLPI